MAWLRRSPQRLPEPGQALPGRRGYAFEPLPLHRVHGRALLPPYPPGCARILFGMGCFWGAERLFWAEPGVWTTAVGYAGGQTPHPTYDEVCTGLTGHAEVVLVVYDPARCGLIRLLQLFWENHDPTQGMRQGADVGTQYRSAIYVFDEASRHAAECSREIFAHALQRAGLRSEITTEIRSGVEFYFAEPYHQQYLARVPRGYCGLQGLGIPFPAEASMSFEGTDTGRSRNR